MAEQNILTYKGKPLVRQGRFIFYGNPDDKCILFMNILNPYIGKLDALVLGCTHYPFVKDAISAIVGERTQLLDGGEGTARQTHRLLAQAGLLNNGLGSVTIENSKGTAALLMLSYDLLDK